MLPRGSIRNAARSARTAGVAVLAGLLATALPPATASAQFGRSKVQYDKFDFRILPSPHFQIYFYPPESLAVADAARMSERWYERHSALLNHTFQNNPLIFYADPPDFQQSNVVEGEIGVGTGGVTEGGRERVIMPFTGIYADNDHVLGHELVHVFQYRIAANAPGGLNSISQIPLWLIEGMAEYLSLGRNDPNTAMWLRDAARRNDLPTIKQLTTDRRYFPYRYGQALWAYIGGRWGDNMVNQLFRAALREGWERSLKSQLGMSADSLSKAWHDAIRTQYANVLTRTPPDSIGRTVIGVRENGDQNVSPTISPDGKYVAFYSSRNLFGIDLYVAETATGKIVRQLTNITRNPHFDALSFINSGGSFSPDGQRLAIVSFAQGDNEIEIINVRSSKVERRIRIESIGGLADPAWSPDGRLIAFSGLRGGISDLYVYDLETSQSRQLTNDREAQLQPAWSPDGRTLAFVTDAGTETNFVDLRFGELRLATIDAAGGTPRLIPRLARGKAINPQYTQAGDALLFVADQDGISDIYRTSLDGSTVVRLTSTSTGISGISANSPTMSVARGTGEIAFSTFDKGGFSIRLLPATAQQTIVAQAGAEGGVAPGVLDGAAAAGVLPPAVATSTSSSANFVERVLSAPEIGLPGRLPTQTKRYRPSLQLESAGNIGVGATFGSGYGTGASGGVAFGFADMLNNNLLQTILQVNGQVRDFGGAVQYLNRARRLNYGAIAQHLPIQSFGYDYRAVQGDPNVNGVVTNILLRQYYDVVSGLVQYPLSATRRLEFSAGFQRIAYNAQVDSVYLNGNFVVGQNRSNFSAYPSLSFGTASAAYVGDFSFTGFTSPIAGGRYRFEISPNVGSINYGSAYADYRRYFFRRPFTLALRGLHFGRYGSGAEDPSLQPLYVGQNPLIRGYDPSDFRTEECVAASPTSLDQCPQYSRLIGTRLAVANVELRIPVFGTEQFGLLNVPFLPFELSPFMDAGVAWSKGQGVDFRFDQNTADRVPVFSAGVTGRFNVLGYAVLEVFYAHPFQRPGRGNVLGFQLLPGW